MRRLLHKEMEIPAYCVFKEKAVRKCHRNGYPTG